VRPRATDEGRDVSPRAPDGTEHELSDTAPRAPTDDAERARRARVPWPRRRSVHIALWLVVLALSVWTVARRSSERAAPRARGLAERLLGPIAGLAAGIQWVRVDAALRTGDAPLAYARAETALALAPGDARGWIHLAHHFLFERASLGREPDLAMRRRWVEAGLDVLARGERVAREPGAIALYEGLVLFAFAGIDDAERPYAGSARQALERAARAFERADLAGEREAAELAARTRARIIEVDR
jgi:hypothetical protein